MPKFLEQLLKKEFHGQQVKMRMGAGDGKIVVKTFGGPAAASS